VYYLLRRDLNTMLIRKYLHLPLLCGLLLCLLASPGGAFGFIWCIGADGHSHAKLQAGQQECCCNSQPASPADDHRDAGLSDPMGRHDDCLHIAITGQLGTHTGRDNYLIDQPLVATDPTSATSLALQIRQVLITGIFPEPPHRIPAPILRQRTIVLLI
jgi:hypothetical protein